MSRTFSHSTDPRRVKIGSDLNVPRQRRDVADYAAVYPGDHREDARNAIQRARAVTSTVVELAQPEESADDGQA